MVTNTLKRVFHQGKEVEERTFWELEYSQEYISEFQQHKKF